MALALARKYRPSTFNDLIGQEAVSKTLSLALQSQKLSHAYLFSGLRGSGKTSTARIFAKAILCENGPTATPCQSCEQCKMANEGRHIDIIEMDAASNRGIEDIKELIEHTKYKPSIGRFKVFIIDEVHMLTVQAFNALLKTLEEPPDFVKFILATTDPLKLPATILSRTQHFRFKKLPQNTISKHLAFILSQEGVEYSDEALNIIARNAQGSMRDAITLLDQAIVYANGKIDTTSVTNMLGVLDPQVLQELINSILNKDRDAIIDFAQKYASYEAEMIIDELTLYLRDKLLSNAPELTTLTIERFFKILAEGKRLLSIGSSGDFVLILTLFKMLEAMEIHTIDAMIVKLQNELKTSVTQTPIKNVEHNISANKIEQDTKQANIEPNINQEESTSDAATPNETITLDTDLPELKFKTLIEKIYDRNYELGTIFENNFTFISYENSTLTWESTIEGEERKLLMKHWPLIKLFVDEVFGLDTKIENITKKKVTSTDNNQPKTKNNTNSYENKHSPEAEEAEQKNSCIMPECNQEACLDKDPNTLLEEPMIKEFLKHLSPKRVVVKQKS